MTYIMQYGSWFIDDCHVFFVKFAILTGFTLCAVKERIPKAIFWGESCAQIALTFTNILF